MSSYKVYLPQLCKQEYTLTLDLLKKHKFDCDLHPGFNYHGSPPINAHLKIAFAAKELKNWRHQDKKILTGFDLIVKNFELESALRGGFAFSLGLKKNDKYDIDLKNVLKDEPDQMVRARLKLCTREITIIEHDTVYGSALLAPAFAAALAQANSGLIFEGEFFKQSNVMSEFLPIDSDIEDMNEDEDEDDGLKPNFFKSWS
ncbi:MAG: hypothetical protein K8F91_05540 [Candidatus Obscuribacterales bacterium]|nr:hypothetical protein [Candidatus Obscuribacterales bacterium]